MHGEAMDPLDAIRKHNAAIVRELDHAATLGLGRWDFSEKEGTAFVWAFLLRLIMAWLPTALLVWLGAPFWHDVLEALFGVKRLVGKKANVRNVEQKSGAGNPKP